MTAQVTARAAPTRQLVSPFFLWLAACVFMMFVCAHAVATGSFPDPDDIMRLMEVRDWLGGQSWFDVTQYRLNGGAGVAMHWSRLVDVPIAAVILMARPFVGPERAETVALVVVPLLTLGIAMLLVHRIAIKLVSSRAALAAVAATPFSLGAMKQMRPMRIDHHGWQIVMALLALLACFDERPRRCGIVAGAAMALWLNISLEGLPYAAAIGAVFAFRWLRDRDALDRLGSYLGAFAIFSLVLFGTTHLPSTWMTQQHDVVTVAYLAGFTTAALSVAALGRISLTSWQKRIVALGVVGAVTLCAMFIVDPHWMVGPFSSLDPLVRRFWYEGVDEGLPMWRGHWLGSAAALAQPIVGLIGACAAARHSEGALRDRWGIYIFLLGATALSSIMVLRVATTASVIAMPGTAYLCQLAFRWARAQSREISRVFSTTAALLVMTPAYALPASLTTQDARIDRAQATESECVKTAEVSRLNALGRAEIVSQLDITPAILLHTDVRALATGHHRNIAGMRDTIRIFISPTPISQAIVAARKVDYVVLCPGAPEAVRLTHFGPDGLVAHLVADRAPSWLQPVQIPGLKALKVWRVRHELLGRSA